MLIQWTSPLGQKRTVTVTELINDVNVPYHVPNSVVSLFLVCCVCLTKRLALLLFPLFLLPRSSLSHQKHQQTHSSVKMFNNAIISFLQLWLATLAFAAPIADEISATSAKPWHYGTGGGIVGFIVLVLDILVWSTYSCSCTVNHSLTVCHSRGPPVEPSRFPQDPLVSRRLPVPHRRNDCLLPVLQPPGSHEKRRLRPRPLKTSLN
jgi:hypothetical protein